MRLIGLDVGTSRIGIAKADTNTRIAVPDGFVNVNGQEFSEIARIARLYDSNTFVIGLPRNNQGLETAQSAYVRKFAHALARTIPGTKIYFQDESLTSVEAERRLKSRKGSRGYAKGDIDAEAAAIILQDCIEHFTNRAADAQPPSQKADIGDIWSSSNKPSPKPPKSKTGKIIAITALSLLVLLGGGFLIAFGWYQDQLKAVKPDISCDQSYDAPEAIPDGCQVVKFSVSESESLSDIAKNLEDQNLIKNALAFQIYARLHGFSSILKAGEYGLREIMSAPDIIDLLARGDSSSNVFSFTIFPGETLTETKENLISLGYDAANVEAAFEKDYSDASPELKTLLSSKPKEASLEGYLYGETYEFYKGESVENIIIRALSELYHVVEINNLIPAYEAQNLTLHEGLTLASIVQKEANGSDQAGVARVFFNRLHQGILLGSDVTAQYAADLIDPERKTLTDNAAIIEVDSPFNTRKYAGLPPGPICNPGLSALLSVAHPVDSDYLYFLTGDDGVIYYSYTEEEHLQNVEDHCKRLCNTQL